MLGGSLGDCCPSCYFAAMLATLEPTKKYFLTMFSLSCALLVVFTCVIYRQSEILQNRGESVLRSYDVLKRSHLVLIDALAMETSQRGFLLSGVPKYLQPYKDAVATLESDVQRLAYILQANSGTFALYAQKLQDSAAAVKAIVAKHIDQSQHGGAHRLTVKDLDEGKQRMDDLRQMLDRIITTEDEVLAQREKAAQEQQRNYQYTLFMGAALGVGALVVANMVIYSLLTRGRETEAELRKSEERFQLIMTGVNDGIYDLNVLDGTMYHSPSCHRILGYSAEEYPETLEEFRALIHPDDLERSVATFRAYAQREKANYVNEFRLRHKNGNWRWIMSRGVGLWNDEGVMYRLVGSQTDITLQKKREDELLQLSSDMEGFTYIASHDLRAPLVNMRGFASEVRMALEDLQPVLAQAAGLLPAEDKAKLEAVLKKEVPESLGFIDAAVVRMDKLTSAILDMSRIGRRQYRMEEVDVNVLLERCLSTLAHEISTKNIKITYQDMPNVVTDALGLEQVFANLLDNAVKYLSADRSGEITIKARTYLDEVIFSIADNGRGIAEHDSRKVFEIFRRAGNSADIRGSGLGMAFVKATLRKLGGRIWFDSVLNEGTTFTFTLPLKGQLNDTLAEQEILYAV